MFTVIVPTRGRPGNLAELVTSWASTIRSESTRLHVVVDGEEGDTLDGYRAVAEEHAAEWWSIE